MNGWINLALDVMLIGLVAAGLVQVGRLIRQLAGLREGRIEMERFVREFNGAVLRAEAGIKNLKQAARASGDDLEKLVDRAVLMRDELQFIVESADQIASRLSQSATSAVRPADTPADNPPEVKSAPAPVEMAIVRNIKKPPDAPAATAASRAEKELMQALEKLG